MRDAEPNLARRPARGDGRSRTLERGKVYLERLYGYADPDAARRWLDAGGDSDPAPGALLASVDPSAFAHLVGAIRRVHGELQKPEAYVRTALADAWNDVLAQRADGARARARGAKQAAERGYAATATAIGCGFLPSPGRAVEAPRWRPAAPPSRS